jgi:hypothetical protein
MRSSALRSKPFGPSSSKRSLLPPLLHLSPTRGERAPARWAKIGSEWVRRAKRRALRSKLFLSSIQVELRKFPMFGLDAADSAGCGAIDDRFRLDHFLSELYALDQRTVGNPRERDDDVS